MPHAANPPSTARRLANGVARLTLLGLAGAGCWLVATEAADRVEARAGAEARLALDGAGFGWAAARADGLQLHLEGTAPDEGARLRAIAAAGAAVDPVRVVDGLNVAPRRAVEAPDFTVELLRNDAGLSMIGLVPRESDRRLLAARLGEAPGRPAVTDLLEIAEHDPPPAWDSALRFGATVVASTPRAKVSIAPGRVAVTAVADDARDKARIETTLRRGKPDDVALTMQVSAPRPVIAPFTLRFVRDAEGARFDACAADSEPGQTRILDAARAAGAQGAIGCTVGLGAPGDWGQAVLPAIAAVGALGAGEVTFTDTAVSLDAPASVPRARFDEAVARLESALPPAYHLTATLERPQPEATPEPPEVTASRAADGALILRGKVADDRMRNVVESLARSHFPAVDAALRADPAVPEGWTLRVIAMLEAMADLDQGSATVTPERITIQGVSGNPTGSDAVAQALGRRLGAGADYSLAVRYDRRLDDSLGLPSGQECVDRANQVMAGSEIGFEPGGAAIAGDVAPAVAALKQALTDCEAFRIEIGGHTDSQGRDETNLALSQQRAEAVLAALREGGVDVTQMTAHGYGESRPLGTNETEAGREANRRIEFTLLSHDPVEPAPAAAPVVEGVTAAVPQAAMAAPPAPSSASAGVAAAPSAPPSVALTLPPAAVPAQLAPPPPALLPEPALATDPPDGYTGPAPASPGDPD